MSFDTIIVAAISIGTLFLCFFIWFSRPKQHRKLPPGPRGLPIIGHLHMLGTLPHRSLHELSKKHGSIMFLKLGTVPTIVVSSPTSAKLFLKTYDTVFANRPHTQSTEYLQYGSKGMAFAPYGPYWRHVRKSCALELFTASKIESFAEMRKKRLNWLVDLMKEESSRKGAVNVSEKVGDLIQSITFEIIFGQSFDERLDMKKIVFEVVELAGAFNLADYVPLLRPFDLQGLTRRLKDLSKTIDNTFDAIIEEHEQNSRNDTKRSQKDFLQTMLSWENKPINDNYDASIMIDRTDVKAILLELLTASMDTAYDTIDWTLSELFRHPQVMKRVQEELKTIIGAERMVEEKDLPELKYLDMVIMEAYRLHPVAPLLVPRESSEDIMVDGYFIPKKSRVLINNWALGRDPEAWSDNFEKFNPEKFIGSNIDVKGRYFQLLPFGSGRRSCPGMNMGSLHVKLILAQLLHCFNWELPDGMAPNDLDMTEKFGLSLSRAKPLFAIPTYRLIC